MPRSTPISATYRLQFNKDFTFQAATNLLDYLFDLGVTHVYASPIFRSRPGSSHGYDVIDPTRLNPELGSEADFALFQEALRKRGMGLVLDVVPNHMSASSENAWWMDVLENGPGSAYASYFDIDWHPPSRNLDGKILLPVLGKPFGEALEDQELKVVCLEGRLFIQYFEALFPLAPKSYPRVVGRGITKLKEALGEDSPAYQEYSGIVAAMVSLTAPEPGWLGAIGEKRPQFEALRERLKQAVAADKDVERFLNANLADFGGKRREPSSFALLERLLAEQFYMLTYWQNVNEEINYRRFFTITDLVGMRVEDPLVFDATHALVKRLAEQRAVDALRIDHIDGLRDPLTYLNRLKEQLIATPGAGEAKQVSIFVEKILARNEQLPADWPTAGTTGYEFLNALNSFFVDPRGTQRIEQVYFHFIGKQPIYADLLYQKKKLVMTTLLGVEMRSLGHQLSLLADSDRYARDLSRNDLTQALTETTAYLPLYRTYIRNLELTSHDRDVIEHAILEAQDRKFYLKAMNFDFVRDVLLLRNRPHLLPEQREARINFVMRWQQFTGPIMAKAFEDTFLYVYNPLISLNDVSGDPRPSAAITVDFPGFVKSRAKRWPDSLNATSTHDTKRSEDVRARINVLSEIPNDWKQRLDCWAKFNAKHVRVVKGQRVPDRNDEMFLYQTLLGAWPLERGNCAPFVNRLQEYAIKATREAMVHTRWTVPNHAHENGVKSFVASILKCGKENTFLRDFTAFHERITYFGMLNGLSQTLLKIFSPGIPDFYQGSDLWDLRLVDPDNRWPVDFVKRSKMLESIREADARDGAVSLTRQLVKGWRDGRIKLYLIWKALNFRREHRALFDRGDFEPVDVIGARKGNIAAFRRRYRGEQAIAIVPRFLAAANHSADEPRFWENTSIRLGGSAARHWRNVFTQEEVQFHGKKHTDLPVASLLSDYPVVLLTDQSSVADDALSSDELCSQG
jgi:(1->4)-alpha-D-glucan 1-alpha-D-glucosylmutase